MEDICKSIPQSSHSRFDTNLNTDTSEPKQASSNSKSTFAIACALGFGMFANDVSVREVFTERNLASAIILGRRITKC